MINVGEFSVSRYEITKEIWDAVASWARENGYTDLPFGSGRGREGVGCISWFDAVKFTNALSEFCGKKPCYYVKHEIYKKGKYDLTLSNVKNTDGFRLPTAEEWEFACRGGSTTDYFWGDEFIPLPINEYAWCGNAKESCVVREVGMLKPNPLGLYDISGNLFEWCFDKTHDIYRVMMGGSVAFDSNAKSGHHTYTSPEYKCYETGLRVFSSNPLAEDYEDIVKSSNYFGVYVKPRPEYTDLSYENLALKICEELDNSPEALYIKEAQNEPEKLLKRFRSLFVKRLSEVSLDERVLPSGQNFDKEKDEYLKYNFNLRWYGKSGERDIHHIMDKPAALCIAYAKYKDLRYLRKAMEIYRSMLVRFKAEFDCLDSEMLSQRHQTEQTWAWNNGFEPHLRAACILSSFWRSYTAGCDIEEFPCEIVAGIALFLMKDNMYTMIKDGRDNILNQLIQCSAINLKTLKIFREFKSAPVIKEIVEERIKKGLENSIRKDGTALEQSIMYNRVTLISYFDIAEYIDNPKTMEMIKNFSRYLVSVTPPVGGEIAMSTTCGVFPYDDKQLKSAFIEKQFNILENSKCYEKIDWEDKERIFNSLFKEEKECPEFTSINFPFGGITIIRSGWSFDSQMLSLLSPPSGRGHAAANINDIQLWDYGMPMLINAGCYSYRIKQNLPEDQHRYINSFDEYQLSSFSRNTVVSGSNQKRLSKGENNLKVDLENATGFRYYESDRFIFTEGIYSDGYINSTASVHKRKIIYIKEYKLFFILDTVESSNEEEFTQVWQLMPKTKIEAGPDFKNKYEVAGYTPEEIIVEDNIIYTISKTHPNIFIHQFARRKISYERKYGEIEPPFGWFIPAQQSRRVPKTDIHTKWTSIGVSSVLSVISTSETSKNIVHNVKCKGHAYEFMMTDGQSICVEFTENGDFFAKQGNSSVSVYENEKSFAEENGIKSPINSPIGFRWKEKDGYSVPVYDYKEE